MVKELVLMNKANQQDFVKAIEETCVTCGGPHPYYECLATENNTFNAYVATGNYNQGGDVKSITTRSGIAYDGPTIPPTPSPLLKVVERETDATKDKLQDTSSESTAHVQPLVFHVLIPEPNKLSLPDLTSTRKTLELATRSYAYPAGIAEDVFVQVGKFTFPVDFVVINYDVDPRVPLILEIEFLLHQDPSTESNIETINLIFEKFTDEPSLDYLPPSGDDDDDLFDLKSDNDEWKKLLYCDCHKDINSEKDKNKDSKIK
uniref:Reverse transcriptase domain-containing protein n=1 Tax=Tanacetum cinerariifolium TaxID=118510 RepID=A0A699IE64_TANCI|nr:reverse transcriptase domain-containing protein [Tanacetum cinerariifolium]